MTDGKLDALRRDPALRALPPDALLWLGRVVDLLDVEPGEVLSPADSPPQWAYYCMTGRLHVLDRGRPAPPAVAPVLFLPDSLHGRALVAAAPSRVVAVPGRAVQTVLALAPDLRALVQCPRLSQGPRLPQEAR